MPIYRRRPVTVEAHRWQGDNARALERWSKGVVCLVSRDFEPPRLQVGTPEGIMTVSPGDFIIRGLAGDFYACRPAAFHQKYEMVETWD